MPVKKGSSSNPLRSTILKVFSTKYALTLPTQSLLFIEKVLSEFEGQEEEWVTGLELWAREYLRGEDGRGLVDLDALKRAYESLQVKVSPRDLSPNIHLVHQQRSARRQARSKTFKPWTKRKGVAQDQTSPMSTSTRISKL